MKSKLAILFLVAILVIFSGCLYREVEFSEAEKLESPAPVSTEKTITEEVSIHSENTVLEPIEEAIPENADIDRTVITPEEPLPEEPLPEEPLPEEPLPEELLPFVTVQDIWEEFGIKVAGEIWDQPNTKGKKIEDYQLTSDELLLIYNVLSSLPQKLLEELEGITIVYQLTPGAGGLYFSGEKRVIIVGTPDRPEASYTGRGKFISSLYHEIGHHIDYSLLSPKEREDFSQLHNRSQNEKDFASRYGMNYPWEDFATLFEAYCMDTEALLEQASESHLLKEKVEFVSRLFSDYRYKVESNGAIMRFEGDERIVWPYKSRTNPMIEEKLFP
jgi:hypothetical protein